MKFLKKYWFLISFVVAPLFAVLVFFISLNSRIFDSPEQKVEYENHIKYSLSPIQQQHKYLMDSLDKDSAIKKRALTIKNDSIDRIKDNKKDSLIFDIIQKNAVQFFQMKLTNDSIKNELKLIKEHH